jgi:hypothetical protein
MSKKIEQTKCIAISNETHSMLVEHIEKTDGKLGKFSDKAIKEKIERETKKQNN